MKKYVFFVLVLVAIATFLGCHAGGNAPFINVPSESNLVSFEREVGENGRFADITFPSGAVIRCTQDGTLKKGTKITATEQKMADNANASDGTSSYIYNITGKLYIDDALKTSVSVNTLEKPISVTLPNNSTTGTCYIGTRASENDPWRYSLVTDGLADIRFARLQASTPSQCNFNLYRFGINFALFVLNNQSKEEAEVDSVEITPTEDVEYKDEKYVADLNIKVKVSGEKLDGINTDNLKARIVYRSDSLNSEQLKANGNIVKQTDSDDKAVSGTYEHSFEISNIKIESQMSGEAVVSFVLNLDGVSLKAFPTSFLVEFYSDGKAENTLPFIYTQAFSFETKEQQNEPEPLVTYSIAYELDGGEPTGDNPTSYTAENEITLSNPKKEGYTFTGWTDTDLDNPTTKVTIAKGSTGDRNYKANWQQNAPDTYTLTLVAGTGIESVDENKAYEADESITLNYTLKDGYEFDKWSDSEGNAVTSPFTMPAKAVTLTANAKAISYSITYILTEGAMPTGVTNPTSYDITSDTITLNEPIRTGYTFTGWTGSNGNTPEKLVTINKGTTEAKTYTANWSINSYNLTLNKDTGINTVTGAGSYEYNSSVTASCTMLAGYEFDSWTGDFTTETFNMPANNATMTANAKAITYNITYDLAGGSLENGVTNPATYNVESDDITLIAPTKDNYDFLGWEGTDIEVGTVSQSLTIPNGSYGNRNYTASFTPRFTITYELNGGKAASSNPESYNCYTDTITLNHPTKAGSYFMGWSCDGVFGASMTIQIPRGSTGNRVFTANWGESLTITLAEGVQLVLNKCPAGSFMMGSPDEELGHISNETYHKVTLTDDFYIGKFEVTQAQYYAVMGSNPSSFTGDDSRPVECVSYDDLTKASGFLETMNTNFSTQLPQGYHFALPTEAQWEYACRAGTTTSLNNGTDITSKWGNCDNLDVVGWYDGNYNNTTHPVGQKQPNAWNLYDMHGNVYEWCRDGFADYTSQEENPIGVSGDDRYVNRGGAGQVIAQDHRSAFRNYQWYRISLPFIGFRLAVVKD